MKYWTILLWYQDWWCFDSNGCKLIQQLQTFLFQTACLIWEELRKVGRNYGTVRHKVGQTDLVYDQGSLAGLCVQDYKSLCAVAMICATMVNIQTYTCTETHRQHSDQIISDYMISSVSWAKKILVPHFGKCCIRRYLVKLLIRSIPWTVRLSWLKNTYSHPFFRPAIFTCKIGQTQTEIHANSIW